MTDRDDLRLLIAGGFPVLTIETCEEPRAIELLRTLATRLDVSLSRWTATDGLTTLNGADFFSADQLRLVDDTTIAAPRKGSSDLRLASAGPGVAARLPSLFRRAGACAPDQGNGLGLRIAPPEAHFHQPCLGLAG